jgi:uncharacterized membrane protein
MRTSSFYWVSGAAAVFVAPVLCFSEVTLIDWIFALCCISLLPPCLYALSRVKVLEANRLFWMLLIFYAVIHLSYTYSVYAIGLRAYKDTAAFVQCFWNFLHNGDFITTIDGQYSYVAPEAVNHFARHNSPILLLALIPFAIYEDVGSLIVLHTFLLFVTGALAWYWVRLVLPEVAGKAIAALLPFVLLCHAALFTAADFDEIIFLPPLLLWSAIAFRGERKWQFGVSCILIASVKELMISILLVWSIIALWKRRSPAYVLQPIVIGMASFIISFFWVIPHFNTGVASPFLADADAARHLLDPSVIALYWFQTLSVWGLMPLGSPLAVLALPDLLINSFFSGVMPWAVLMILRYQVVIACALFLAAVESLPRISRFVGSHLRIHDADRFLVVLQVTLIVAALQWAGVPMHSLYDQLRRGWMRDRECIEFVASTNDPVAADYNLCGYFAKRHVIWSWNTIYFPDELYSQVQWFVGVKSDTIPAPVVAWDRVCEGENVFVLKNPHRNLPVSTAGDEK